MTQYSRSEFDFPLATDEWGWKYHHLGIPTTEKRENEIYLPQYKFYVSGFKTSPFGIEWMRFEPDCSINPLIQKVPHLAFVVNNIEEEVRIREFNLISELGSPMDGILVAMIEHNGAPIELMQFE